MKSMRVAAATVSLLTPTATGLGTASAGSLSDGGADAAEAASVAVPGVAPSGDIADAVYIAMDGQRLGTAAELGLNAESSPAALGCTPVSGRDNPHRSSTGVAASGHGWSGKGSCNNDRADVLNCLYEWYTDRSWRMKTCSPVKELAPGAVVRTARSPALTVVLPI
jgi:hypothetical protein